MPAAASGTAAPCPPGCNHGARELSAGLPTGSRAAPRALLRALFSSPTGLSPNVFAVTVVFLQPQHT